MMIIRLLIRLIKVSAMLLLCVSCQKQYQPNSMTTFFYNESNGIASLDPALASYQSSVWAGSQIFNGLVEYDSSMNITGCLATSWTVDSQGTKWRFTLRKNVSFQEDSCFSPHRTRFVTSHDVKYSFERILDARTKSTGLWVFRKRLVGAEEFHRNTKKGDVPASGCEGIVCVDDTTIEFQLTAPFAPFLALLTMPYCWVLPKEAILHYGERFGEHPVGTGAFRIETWSPDRYLRLVRNSHYFKKDRRGQSLPYLQNVQISFIRDTKTEFLEFKRGHLDVLTQIDPAILPAIMNFDGTLRPEFRSYRMQQIAAYQIEYYGILLDTTNPISQSTPLASSRLVRQALNYAIDRERIVKYILRGKGTAALAGPLPPSMPGFDTTLVGYSYNVEKARKLLQQAGFGQGGKKFPPLVLQMGNSERSASVGEAVQEMWKSVGVDVELRQVDFPQHLDMVRSGKLHLWRTSWVGDYPDPENFLALFFSANHSPNGPNTSHISSPLIDSLYQAALSPLLTNDQRFSLYHRLEREVVNESPWIFLYYNILQRLSSSSLHGLTLDGSDRLVLERVYK